MSISQPVTPNLVSTPMRVDVVNCKHPTDINYLESDPLTLGDYTVTVTVTTTTIPGHSDTRIDTMEAAMYVA